MDRNDDNGRFRSAIEERLRWLHEKWRSDQVRFNSYRVRIDELERYDFTEFFTPERLENEESLNYFNGLNIYQDNLFDYIRLLQEQDASFLESNYHDDKIDHFFGSPMILATTLREHIDKLKEIFSPDEFIIIDAIAEINLRYNRLEETIAQLKSLNSYTSLWAQDNISASDDRLQHHPRPPTQNTFVHFKPSTEKTTCRDDFSLTWFKCSPIFSIANFSIWY